MSNNTEIKPQNFPKLTLFFVLNVSVFFILASDKSFNASMWKFIKDIALTENGAIFLIASLAIIVLDGVVPNGLKDFFVFWRRPHPLPGHRAFTVIAKKSPDTIDLKVLRKYANPLPKVPAKQNKLWMDIYEKYQDHPSVTQVHRAYLLTREMTSLCVLFALLFPTVLYLIQVDKPDHVFALKYFAVLFVQFILIATSSRSYGNGLVHVVLVRASATVRK